MQRGCQTVIYLNTRNSLTLSPASTALDDFSDAKKNLINKKHLNSANVIYPSSWNALC